MDLAEVIVVIGGCDRKGLLKLPFADIYHPESQRWTPLPSLPGYTRSEFATCTLRNDVYVSGEGGAAASVPQDWLTISRTLPSLFFPPTGMAGGAGSFQITYSYWLRWYCRANHWCDSTLYSAMLTSIQVILITSLHLVYHVLCIMLNSLDYLIPRTTKFYRETKNFPVVLKMANISLTSEIWVLKTQRIKHSACSPGVGET